MFAGVRRKEGFGLLHAQGGRGLFPRDSFELFALVSAKFDMMLLIGHRLTEPQYQKVKAEMRKKPAYFQRLDHYPTSMAPLASPTAVSRPV
jgi:hypothetical protein